MIDSDMPEPAPDGLVIRIRYRPELLPDCVIELQRRPESSAISVATWDAAGRATLLEGRAELGPGLALEPPMDPFACVGTDADNDRGGASFQVQVRSPSRRHDFIDAGAGSFELIRWMYLLARHQVAGSAAQRALDQVYRGCALSTPPWVDLGGQPRRVRVFGDVTRGNASALRDLLVEIPTATPTVLDLEALGNIDSTAIEVFRAFDRRMARAAFVLPARLMPDTYLESRLAAETAKRRRLRPGQRAKLVRSIEETSLSHQLSRARLVTHRDEIVL